jgi:hypothetical protein
VIPAVLWSIGVPAEFLELLALFIASEMASLNISGVITERPAPKYQGIYDIAAKKFCVALVPCLKR